MQNRKSQRAIVKDIPLKETVRVRFDRDVLEKLRKHKDWQGWINNLARVALSFYQLPKAR